MYKNILLAVDGSEHALNAATLAGEMARFHQASLRIVVVYDPMPAYLGEPDFQYVVSARLEHATVVIDEAQKFAGEIPAGVHTEILEGPEAEAILNVATTRENDLIIMGTRGLGRLTGFFLGSVSQKVVAHAACPVLLVK